MEEGKVIPFTPIDKPRFTLVKRNKPFCKHWGGITIDEQNRTVECNTCKCVMDAFDYLLSLAIEEMGVHNHIKIMKADRQRLSDEIVSLEKKKANLRSAINREGKKVG